MYFGKTLKISIELVFFPRDIVLPHNGSFILQ